jgi:hypothetical protein
MKIRFFIFLTAICLSLFSPHAHAQTALYVTINPVRILPASGSPNFTISEALFSSFKTATTDIWGQAGVNVVVSWNTLQTVTSASLYNAQVADGSANSASRLWNQALPSTTFKRDDTPFVIDLWIVGTLVNSGLNVIGYSNQGGDGIAVSESVFQSNFLGTIAHELGHNLGLNHVSGSTIQLMHENSIANTVSFTLSAGEISTARSSPLLSSTSPIPEPQHLSILTGLAVMGWIVRQRWRRSS